MRGDSDRRADITDACQRVASLLESLSAGLDESLVIDAIKYNLIAIGEAANHLSDGFKEQHTDVEWDTIVGLRHMLTHEYFRIDHAIIVQIARRDVPNLVNHLS